MRNRLQANPGSLSFSLFVKGTKICSQCLLFVSDLPLLPKTRAEDDTVFGGEKDTLLLSFPAEQHPLVRIQRRALQYYRPGTYPGDLVLFSTGADEEFYPGDPTRGWGSCTAGKTTVIEVPGNHENLFENPRVQVLAQKIEEALRKADEPG
jgi:hypothetical protein